MGIYNFAAHCYKGPMNNTKNTTVYLSNLSYRRDRNGLRSIFVNFGNIKDIKIVVEPKTQQSRGMAFIEMATNAEAKKAIEELNNKVIDGRTVKASWAIPQKKAYIPAAMAKELANTPKKQNKDLDFTATQLAKKARNEARRNKNPFRNKISTKGYLK